MVQCCSCNVLCSSYFHKNPSVTHSVFLKVIRILDHFQDVRLSRAAHLPQDLYTRVTHPMVTSLSSHSLLDGLGAVWCICRTHNNTCTEPESSQSKMMNSHTIHCPYRRRTSDVRSCTRGIEAKKFALLGLTFSSNDTCMPLVENFSPHRRFLKLFHYRIRCSQEVPQGSRHMLFVAHS